MADTTSDAQPACETCNDLKTVPARIGPNGERFIRVDCPGCTTPAAPMEPTFDDEPTVETEAPEFAEVAPAPALAVVAGGGSASEGEAGGGKVTPEEIAQRLAQLLGIVEAMELEPREKRRRLSMAKQTFKVSMLASCKCGLVHPGPKCPICDRVWDPKFGPAAMHKRDPAMWRQLLAWIWADLTRDDGPARLAGEKVTAEDEENAINVFGEEGDEEPDEATPPMPPLSPSDLARVRWGGGRPG